MSINAATFPYWRLSGFYLFYFAILGVVIPYFGPWLKFSGFTAQEIAQLTAAIMASRLISPNILGWIADHTNQALRLVQLFCILGALSFALVFVEQSYHWLMFSFIAFSFFWNAVLPQFESITLAHLGKAHHRYPQIRLWGSVGFILTVMGLGLLLEQQSPNIVPLITFFVLLGLMLNSLTVPDHALPHHHDNMPSFKTVLLRREVQALFVICFLMQASHGAYYTFYSIYLQDHGYTGSSIGSLWALGVIAEIALFLGVSRYLKHYQLSSLLLISLLLAVLRWLLIGLLADSLMILIIAQLLHAATFGLYHAVSIQYIHRYFPGRLQGRGQALHNSLSFGAGNAVGALISGYLWDYHTTLSFILCSLFALIAAWLCSAILSHEHFMMSTD
ncbi:MFS transporter [Candidatus Venteria ishoeyi]|uniref:Putative 3-phenylpropionic acid transporter n=1 Tax=Candidatus Venteria ishoeyi TaxID=1899563 RepID=A0A1H6FFH6_9GAMM|nr:MFS transporter [Candidatus Venteria ishoeyi]MDM8545308.1 MFS transporter [Candidatus Venteria ishoeyi]SEH07926.1 putative 3-phenylpropionic acid transporter [Candidatus Venteria ishoeyi]